MFELQLQQMRVDIGSPYDKIIPKSMYPPPKVERIGDILEDFIFEREKDYIYSYSLVVNPAGCCCDGCCSVMGWDKPRSSIVIYKRKYLTKDKIRVGEFDLTFYTKQQVLDFFGLPSENPKDEYCYDI